MSQSTIDRRSFVKFCSVTAAFFAAGFHQLQAAASAAVSALMLRVNSIYDQDATAPVRKPQDNQDVKKLYDGYLGVPLSQLSEKLLHTSFEDRSARIKALAASGIKLTLKTSITKL